MVRRERTVLVSITSRRPLIRCNPPADGQCAAVKVDISPLQAKSLASAEPEEGNHDEQGVEPVVAGGLEEHPDLLDAQRVAFLPRCRGRSHQLGDVLLDHLLGHGVLEGCAEGGVDVTNGSDALATALELVEIQAPSRAVRRPSFRPPRSGTR